MDVPGLNNLAIKLKSFFGWPDREIVLEKS
jgi:hypothetical protein